MEVKSIYVHKLCRYDLETKERVVFYNVSITLGNDKETTVSFKLNDNEQNKLLNTLADILPEKLNEFGKEFRDSLTRSDNEEKENG